MSSESRLLWVMSFTRWNIALTAQIEGVEGGSRCPLESEMSEITYSYTSKLRR